MIAELSVSHLAIIDQTQLNLGPGFTVLTGETGAGKSLLIDAIQLVLGERAESELVRANAKSATVAVVFDLTDSPEVIEKCTELGVPLEDSRLFVSREVFAEGRSQCRLGGRLMPNSILRQLGELLVDLHGQHDHQSLLQQDRHLGYFDRWIGAPAEKLLSRISKLYSQYLQVQRSLESIQSNIRERDHKVDLLRHQIGEIEAISPQIGEFEALQTKIGRLQNLEKLTTAVQGAAELLSTGDGSALEQIEAAAKLVDGAKKYEASLIPVAEQLTETAFILEEAIHSLSKIESTLDLSPDELEESASRLESLKKLRRKYGDDEESVLRFASDASAQLALLEDVEASEEALEKELDAKKTALLEASTELSVLRIALAKEFSAHVEEQLRDLALPSARFGVGIKPTEPSPTGIDDVEFVFSANPGEPLRPLQRVASGGEVSRLMLAMKTVLAGKAGVPTLIFDEVDSGLGGRVGATVGRKLLDLSSKYQIIVISHLPQVAAQATAHFRIEKVMEEGRTLTQVRRLDSEERLDEIARMLGGETITDTALAHAKEMLTRA